MANKPGKFTRSTSFTLPVELYEAIKNRAAVEMVNESFIIRRALLNDLPRDERERVLEAILKRTPGASTPKGSSKRQS